MKVPVTVLIAARNEEANIGRCLASLKPAERVIVVDSKSDDRTAEIACAAGAEIVQFQYRGGYPKKRQWALDCIPIQSPWILLLDADEAVPEDLWDEIRQALSLNCADAFFITKGFHFLGKRFRFGGFSHSAILLFRRGKARFEHLLDNAVNGQDMEVHERVLVAGATAKLSVPLIHQDFKGLHAYIDRHNKYSTWEALVRANYLLGHSYGRDAVQSNLFGNAQERRRFLKMLILRVPSEPLLWFFYHYIIQLGFLEGRRGLIASHLRASYIAQTRAKMYELGLQRSDREISSSFTAESIPAPIKPFAVVTNSER